MVRPSGSWVAIPTPFNKDGEVDFGGFRELVDFHLNHQTSMLFCLGSAGEATLLTLEERKQTVKEMVKICGGRIPVFFGATLATTKETVYFARFVEEEGGDGLVFTAPGYLLPPQTAVRDFLLTVMQSVSIPVGIYNNPARTGIMISPGTLEFLVENCPNFVVAKEASADVAHLVEIKIRFQDRLSLMCCDFPKYSIVLPTLAFGGDGTANIGGNVIPEEMALMSRPWTSQKIMEECRETYYKYYELLKALYWYSNPIVIKAALNLLGLPVGHLRRPYPDLGGSKLNELKSLMEKTGVIEKYSRF